MTVHASGFSLPDSCSRSVLGSIFGVLCSVLLRGCGGGYPPVSANQIVGRARLVNGILARVADDEAQREEAV